MTLPTGFLVTQITVTEFNINAGILSRCTHWRGRRWPKKSYERAVWIVKGTGGMPHLPTTVLDHLRKASCLEVTSD